MYEPLFTPAGSTDPPKGTLLKGAVHSCWFKNHVSGSAHTTPSALLREESLEFPPECCKQQGFQVILLSEPVTSNSPKSGRLLDMWGPSYHFMWAGGMWQMSLSSLKISEQRKFCCHLCLGEFVRGLWFLHRGPWGGCRVSLLALCHLAQVWNCLPSWAHLKKCQVVLVEDWFSWPPGVSPDLHFPVIPGWNGSELRTSAAQATFISTERE